MTQKSVLITGCTPGGIGFAVANEFRARGFHVIASARSEAVVQTLSDKGFDAVKLDVTDAASIMACHDRVKQITGGKLDMLMNNAGRGLSLPATDSTLDEIRGVYEANVFGTMAMVNAFIDLLLPARGLIINVASISALIPYVWGSVYASSKAAVVSYSRSLRQELRPFGVRVQVVMAGAVKSNISANTATKKRLPPESLYQRVRHLYMARQGHSQSKAAGSLPTEVFAGRLVDKALATEVSPFWRIWFGRPDASYGGGMARLLWWGSVLGDWVTDFGVWRTFKLSELERMVKKERGVSLTNKAAIE